jgi:serine/threonine protein kinase
MSAASATALVDALRRYRLLDPEQAEELTRNLQAHCPDPKALAGELIWRGWLTPYQANRVFQGRGQDLLLGSYVLLEKLGEGGMGAVFKAKNWKLGRVVALKVIRKERLANPDIVRRFQREVRAAAALDHPHIVRALDADEIGGTHLLVMEYVEKATDLARLVKQTGPLAVGLARESIRQAALGLQHAHERGLVHRDVKPHNLLLTADRQTVKLLDLGLARINHPAADEPSSTMTREGTVMGTPDYIAPEQALESHAVDIRADIYSLGCTLYFLLAGHVPFPGGSMAQKLLRHQSQEPRPIEQVRAEVPAGLAAVVRKAMAKRPEDRYQTPLELADTLAGLLHASPVVTPDVQIGVPRAALEVEAAGETPRYLAVSDTAEGPALPTRQRDEERRQWRWIAAGAAVLFGLLGLLAILLLRRENVPENKASPPPGATRSEPQLNKPFDPLPQRWLDKVARLPPAEQVQEVADVLRLRNPGFDGKTTHRIDNGAVVELSVQPDDVTDLSPVRALSDLQKLYCLGNWDRKGKLADLTPLRGMKLVGLSCTSNNLSDLGPIRDLPQLRELWCFNTRVRDLAPLRGMSLNHLEVYSTPVSDLSPLKGMPLTHLNVGNTQVTDLAPLEGMRLQALVLYGTRVRDLSPLKGMPLTFLVCHATPVSDLAPLQNMPLTLLSCSGTPVNDLSPLKGMLLKELHCDFKPERDADILRSLKTLEKINGKPVKEFWKEVDARKP